MTQKILVFFSSKQFYEHCDFHLNPKKQICVEFLIQIFEICQKKCQKASKQITIKSIMQNFYTKMTKEPIKIQKNCGLHYSCKSDCAFLSLIWYTKQITISLYLSLAFTYGKTKLFNFFITKNKLQTGITVFLDRAFRLEFVAWRNLDVFLENDLGLERIFPDKYKLVCKNHSLFSVWHVNRAVFGQGI